MFFFISNTFLVDTSNIPDDKSNFDADRFNLDDRVLTRSYVKMDNNVHACGTR